MIDEARREAERVLAALSPFIDRGTPMIGLEPACLLTLRDEFGRLVPGQETAALAQNALTFEEFLAQEHRAGKLALRFGEPERRRALVHGHCHQKAFGLMRSVVETLSLVPGLEVETIESGCCGMAGDFGYDTKHFETSMRMAELALLPAIRDTGDDTVVVADGTSCRHQILDGCRREARHVAPVLADCL